VRAYLALSFALLLGDELRRAPCDRAVVDMHCQNEGVLPDLRTEYPRVRLANAQAEVSKDVSEGVVPFAPGLLQSVERLSESLDLALALLVPGRLLECGSLRPLLVPR
jgi:hypothetical protein